MLWLWLWLCSYNLAMYAMFVCLFVCFGVVMSERVCVYERASES